MLIPYQNLLHFLTVIEQAHDSMVFHLAIGVVALVYLAGWLRAGGIFLGRWQASVNGSFSILF
jgi:hypothetical protein